MVGSLEPRRNGTPLLSAEAGSPRSTLRPHCGVEASGAVARVASVSGGVSHSRGGDADDWEPAFVGLPVASGDRLYAARGACLELWTSGCDIRLSSGSGLEAIGLAEGARRFYVWGGSAAFLVRELRPRESFGVDTAAALVTFERAGQYRIDVGSGGETCVSVGRGSAWVSGAGVAVALESGDFVRLGRIEGGSRDAEAAGPPEATEPGEKALPSRDQVLPFPLRPGH